MATTSNLFSGGTETTSTSNSVPSWMVPYVQNYLQTSQNLAKEEYNPYEGQTVAQLNPYQTQAYNAMANRAIQGSPLMDAASAEAQKTASGGYLNPSAQNLGINPYAGANPYLGQMINAASGDITRNYNNAVVPQLTALDARSGSFGNSGVASATGTAQGELARSLGDVSSGLRFNDYTQRAQLAENAANRRFQGYQAERGRQQSAVSQAPGLANQDYIDAGQLAQAGEGFQRQNQANLTDQFQRFQDAQAYPYKQLQTLGTGLGMNFGSTTTQQTPGTSPFATGLGTAASLYGLSKGASKPTVICTELHRQGRMSDEIYALDQAYGAALVRNDPAVYAGYIQLATPVVGWMRKSRLVSAIVEKLATPWATEMAHQMGMPKGSIVGKLIMAVGYPMCRRAAKRAAQKGVA